MALIRLRPFPQAFDPSQMNRLFDSFFGAPSQPELMEGTWTPPVDMYETKNEVVVTAELPGVNEKDIRLSITGDLLTIQGERQWSGETREAGHYCQERRFGKFERVLSLPIPVETSQVKATYRDGVLTVKLPKTEGVKPREIKIDAA